MAPTAALAAAAMPQGRGCRPQPPASEAGVACARWLRTSLYVIPISSRRCPVSRTGGPAPGLRHPLRLGGTAFRPSGSVRKADKQHGYSHMARTRGMQYTGQGPALQSRQEGTPVGDKDRKSPDLTFVAPSHQSNPERQSGTTIRNERRHVMARYAFAATIRGARRSPSGEGP